MKRIVQLEEKKKTVEKELEYAEIALAKALEDKKVIMTLEDDYLQAHACDQEKIDNIKEEIRDLFTVPRALERRLIEFFNEMYVRGAMENINLIDLNQGACIHYVEEAITGALEKRKVTERGILTNLKQNAHDKMIKARTNRDLFIKMTDSLDNEINVLEIIDKPKSRTRKN